MENKINKVNAKVVKVTVALVKPQITFVKRTVSKYLLANKLAAKTNTATKPEAIKLNDTQAKAIQAVIVKGIKEIATKYPHTTTEQVTYIKNHFNTHSMKYLK